MSWVSFVGADATDERHLIVTFARRFRRAILDRAPCASVCLTEN